jgi:MFS family permease
VSAGATLIVWYDFFIFGALAATISPRFFPTRPGKFTFIVYLSTFLVSFVVRPLGALLSGRIGDRVGRKFAFLLTLFTIAVTTTLTGSLPTYRQIGLAAPLLLIALRVLQGLAFGGEYAGAIIYLAEHVPVERRGYYTGFIQATTTLGLLASLAVLLIIRNSLSQEAFAGWGWRVPFLLSIFLIVPALYLQMKMKETPVFEHLKRERIISRNLRAGNSGSTKRQSKAVLIAFFGATAGQGVIWYTGQFYALFYLQSILQVNHITATWIIVLAHLAGLPLFVFFGRLSDRRGRKRIILAGCLLAAVLYIPIYMGMQRAAGTNVVSVQVMRNPFTGVTMPTPQSMVNGTLQPVAEATKPRIALLIALVFIQVLFMTMVGGPLGAYLPELFPAGSRYTSLSLAHQMGNGVCGSLLPVVSLALVAANGNIYAGLYYPVAVALLTFITGAIFLKETGQMRMADEPETGEHDPEKIETVEPDE